MFKKIRTCCVVIGIAAFVTVLMLALAAPSTSATKVGGCPASQNWTAVDFVYSGDYESTGIYQYVWVTHPEIGATLQNYFNPPLSVEDAYFYGVNYGGPADVDRNGDQVICIAWIGGNRGLPDSITSEIDNQMGTDR
jgi:hypothetical protein